MFDVFISHNHKDKKVARRIARRLGSYGIKPWLDESELQLSNVLSRTIKKRLQECANVLVIASSNSIHSKWVERELTYAKEMNKPIYPLFVEKVSSHTLFSDYLGLDLSDKYLFEQNLKKLISSFVGKSTPTLDRNYLLKGLRQFQVEEPHLQPLIEGCLSGRGMLTANLQTIGHIPFHVLDFTLCSLFELGEDLKQKRLVCYHIAPLFFKNGSGSFALEQYLPLRESDDTLLASTLGVKLRKPLLKTAIRLLSVENERDDHALANFIHKNAANLGRTQINSILFLLTTPFRKPKGSTLDALFTVLKYFPDREEPIQVLDQWITTKEFDGLNNSTSTPNMLIRCIHIYLGKTINQEIVRILLVHIKGLIRSKNRQKVMAAIDYLIAASKEDIAILNEITELLEAAPGSHEWSNWQDGKEISIYLWEVIKETREGKDFLKAKKNYIQDWDVYQQFEALKKANEIKNNGSEEEGHEDA